MSENARPASSRTRFLAPYVLPSDDHPFIGRIYDLSIVAYAFEDEVDLARHPDAKYALMVNEQLTTLAQRVKSLNLVGNMLWPTPVPKIFKDFPVSRYEWLTISADVFLMRYISVVDCGFLLTNEVFQIGLDRRKCSLEMLRRRGVPTPIVSLLQELQADQGTLRDERNARFHQGIERPLMPDDLTFKIAALFEHRLNGIKGTGQDGRRINVERSFKEGLVELQREFNRTTRKLVRQLNRLYDRLGSEFEVRFTPLFRAGRFCREQGAP